MSRIRIFLSCILAMTWSLPIASPAAPALEAHRIDAESMQLSARGGITALAVSDRLQLLAIGFGPEQASEILLAKIDGRGQVNPEPRALPLPGAKDSPPGAGHCAGLLFHPDLPLLYAWRHPLPPDETKDEARDKAGDEALFESFTHLVVYDLSDPENPGVQGSFARGQIFAARRLPAHPALSPNGQRLYIPNLQILPERGALRAAVGYIPLDESGRPLLSGDRAQLEWVEISGFQSQPTGRGFLPAGNRVLLLAAQNGFLTWDTLDRRAELSRLLLPGLPTEEGFVGGNETRVYWASEGTGHLRGIRHSTGFPTLLPERHGIPDAAFHSPPVVLGGKTPSLAIGGRGGFHRIGLNGQGEFNGDDLFIDLDGTAKVTVLAYSEKFNMLYVPMEKQP